MEARASERPPQGPRGHEEMIGDSAFGSQVAEHREGRDRTQSEVGGETEEEEQ